ncbi:MAG: DNA internalization-related competence protein ComEC/Rec2 [Eggerthellaceae bacterium]|jgi:competence protein ComEC
MDFKTEISSDFRKTVPRPGMVPLLVFALALWVACALFLSLGCNANKDFLRIFTCLLCCIAVPLVGGLLKSKHTVIFLILLGLCAGLALASIQIFSFYNSAARLAAAEGDIRYEALEDGSLGPFGIACEAQAYLENNTKVKVILSFDEESELPHYGDLFVADASPQVFESPEDRSYYWNRGIVGRVDLQATSKQSRSDFLSTLLGLRNSALDAFSQESSTEVSVLKALVCAWRPDLDSDEIYDDFKTCGLAHLVAVSGAHLVIVLSCISILLNALNVSRRIAIVVLVIFLGAYLIFTAMPISALRAAIMSTLSLASFFSRRRPQSLNALGLCIVLIIFISPASAVSISLLLSAVSTLGIVLFYTFFKVWISFLIPILPKAILEVVALTLSANLGTQVLSIAFFAQLPLISLVANLLAAPLFPLVCFFGLLAAVIALVFPPLFPLVFSLAAFSSALICHLIYFLSSMPFAAIPASIDFVPAFCIALFLVFGLWVVWPQPRNKKRAYLTLAISLVFVSVAVFVPNSDDEVVMLDVGQGDAFLIRSEGKQVLIDTGNQPKKLRTALGRHGVVHLDYLFITHADDDHCGSLYEVSYSLDIGRVALAQGAATCDDESTKNLVNTVYKMNREGPLYLRPGDTFKFGKIVLKVLAPKEFKDDGGNADSLILSFEADMNHDTVPEYRGLFVGDAEADQIEDLVKKREVSDIDILKVGHHGSEASVTQDLLKVLRPKIALISVGAGNRYGHPAKSTLEALAAAGSRIYRSDKLGDISCKLRSSGFEIRSSR